MQSFSSTKIEKDGNMAKIGLPCWNCPSTLIFIGNTTAHIVRNTLVFLILALSEKLQPETSAEPVFFHCVEKFDRRFFPSVCAPRVTTVVSRVPKSKRPKNGRGKITALHLVLFLYEYTIVYAILTF